MTTPELLAPAGDFASLTAALDSGADAIYLGIGAFNMRRAVTGAFTLENLPQAARACREKNANLYLTVNTLIYQNELEALRRHLETARPWIHAAIVGDLATLALCRELGIPIHISTQFSCANITSAKLLADLGARRIVLARECTLREIGQITAESPIPIEIFAHGAQCLAQSGRCHLSQEAYGPSASRGQCLQPCRRQYRITEEPQGPGSQAQFIAGPHYLLSARDLCTLPILPRLVASGAAALKIEGRARNPEYVKTVTAAYRRGLSAIAAGTWSEPLLAELQSQVDRVYHRPFGTGLLLGRPGDNPFCETDENQATEKKIYLGTVVNYYQTPRIAHILLHDHTLTPGDRLAIHGPATGVAEFTAAELRQDEKILHHARRGDWCTLPAPRCRPGDKIYRILSLE